MPIRKLMLAGWAALLIGAAPGGSCDRACLIDMAEKDVAAMIAHDPSQAPLAHNARYTENGVELPLPDGLWRTLESVGRYRLFVADPREGSIGFFFKASENGAPLLVAMRLKVAGRQILEMESIVARLGATVGGGPSGLERLDQLGEAPRPQFLTRARGKPRPSGRGRIAPTAKL